MSRTVLFSGLVLESLVFVLAGTVLPLWKGVLFLLMIAKFIALTEHGNAVRFGRGLQVLGLKLSIQLQHANAPEISNSDLLLYSWKYSFIAKARR
jgi:hypothetical protein